MFDSNSILTKFRQASGGVVSRGDLYVCDVMKIDSEKCKAIIAYDKTIGVPGVQDVYRFANESWGQKVVPQLDSLKSHPTDDCLSVVFSANVHTRPALDAANMRKLTESTFVEPSTNSIWSLVTSSDGSRALVRNIEENVTSLVSAACRARAHTPKFATLRTAAPFVDKGDSVKFLGPKNISLYGVVSNISGDNVTIKTDNDGVSHTVSRYAITELVSKGKGAIAKEKDMQTDFFAAIWGSRELAEQFTKNDANDGVIQDLIPTFNGR